jgi:hypothetical protein
MEASAGPRQDLRVFLTILVIAHHVGQAYGPTSGAWPVQEPARVALLGVQLAPLAKFALVTLVGVPLVFAWSHLVRRLRVVRSVL